VLGIRGVLVDESKDIYAAAARTLSNRYDWFPTLIVVNPRDDGTSSMPLARPQSG